MAHAIHPSRSALAHRPEDLRLRADKLITFGESPAEREAGALLHELLDGYRSPARHDQEVRELQEEVREAHRDVVELEIQAESAAQDLARALKLLAKVRVVCADEVTLDEVIALIEGIDLG